MSKIVVGVMGPGRESSADVERAAFEVGRLVASEGWVLLTGGSSGVMDAASKGAKEANGITVGILSGESYAGMSTAVDIPIITGMGQARNNINILSSNVVIACGIGPGTAAEIALAIKARKKIILLGCDKTGRDFFKELGGDAVVLAESPEEVMALAKEFLRADKCSTTG